MQVNRINLIKHEQESMTYKQAKPLIYSWLSNVSRDYSCLTPFGNAVNQDINKICDCVISKDSWENFVDRRVLELSSIGKFLQLNGMIPLTQSLSLSKIAEYFGEAVDSDKVHTASGDVEIGASVLKHYSKFLEHLKR